MQLHPRHGALCFFLCGLLATCVWAQSTGFTYQGRLTDGATAANGTYDFQFKLYSAVSGGTALATASQDDINVTGGVFTVLLDFGALHFANNAAQFLEICVRPGNQTGAYTTLAPRQPLSTAPYALKSLTAQDALQLGGTPAGQFATKDDPRMTDAREPKAGSANYIQNGNATQAASNFHISGNGAADGTLSGNVISAATQYNLGSARVLFAQGGSNENTFVGLNAGGLGNTGQLNSFFGWQAGQNNGNASANAFFGARAGAANTTGFSNAFFGAQAGQFNTTGEGNSFFGAAAGYLNTTGSKNAFFGRSAGEANTTGQQNAFFGTFAGKANSTGSDNAFFGSAAGLQNTTGYNNAFFGSGAGSLNSTGNTNSFFGAGVGLSNTIGAKNAFFGTFAGAANTEGHQNTFFGHGAGQANTSGGNNAFFGNLAGQANTTGILNAFFGAFAGFNNTTGEQNTFVGLHAGVNNTTGTHNVFVGRFSGYTNLTGTHNTLLGNNADVVTDALTFATAIGAGTEVDESNTIVLGRATGNDNVRIPGKLTLKTLGAAGSTPLCRNASNQISTCSSSLRYKTNLTPFTAGLQLVQRLRPLSFTWKDGGLEDLGFGAEDVAQLDPRLVIYNAQGQVEGVKYDRLSVLFVNAFKEQHTLLEQQQQQLAAQQRELAALKRLVCASQPQAEVCR